MSRDPGDELLACDAKLFPQIWKMLVDEIEPKRSRPAATGVCVVKYSRPGRFQGPAEGQIGLAAIIRRMRSSP